MLVGIADRVAVHRHARHAVRRRREKGDLSALSPPIPLVGLSGSLRAQSHNSAALHEVASLLLEGMSFAIASLIELPFHNSDVEQQRLPNAVQSLHPST
jgi:hypothetical protein